MRGIDEPVMNSQKTFQMSRKKKDFVSSPLWLWMDVVLLAGMFGLTGCSSFQEVTTFGHGEQISQSASLPQTVGVAPVSESPPPSPGISEPHPNSTLPSKGPVSANTPVEEITTDIVAQPAEEASLPWTLEDVFFSFDQYVIEQEAIRILEQNAKVIIKRYAGREVILEGHCDERGTEEYNLILGGRRASAVKQFLRDLGVPEANMRVLSLGKAQPFCQSKTLNCFGKNRRVHFVFK